MEENVIALVRKDGRWVYYATEVDVWVLDWAAWQKAFVDAGYPATPVGGDERGGVMVLNQETAGRALAALEESVVSEEELRRALRAEMPIASWEQVMHLFPTVLVDFDARRLCSVYSEPLALERYVPAGWTGKHGDFYGEVPVEHRYWLDGEADYLKTALRR